MSTLSLLKDSILFKFAQKSRDGFFRGETDWGFEISGADIDASKPRWGIVELIGPDVKYVTVGDFIMIDALKWTAAVEYENTKLWRTTEPQVLLMSKDRPSNLV